MDTRRYRFFWHP